MRDKKLSPIEKHSARTFIMLVFTVLFVGLLVIIIELTLGHFFPIFSNMDLGMGIGTVFMVYVMWKTNVRFGWVENIIEGERKHPRLSAWFESVTGK